MRRIEIAHLTTYQYTQPVEFLPHKLHVRPREGHDIRIESSSLDIEPAYTIEWQRDIFGNLVPLNPAPFRVANRGPTWLRG